MAKKPRSQRRKKGNDMDGGGDEGASSKLDALSDTHTVDESVGLSILEDDYAFGDDNISDLDFQDTGASQNSEEAMQVRYQHLQDHLATVDEIPSEKRSARREATFRKLFRALSHYATGEAGRTSVEHRVEEIKTACFLGIRSGSSAEQYAACRVLEVTSVILGGDQDDFYEAVEKQLRRVVMTAITRATAVRVAALRALAMANLICASDQEAAESLLDFCEEVAKKEYRGHAVPDILRAAALDCWALMGTTLSDHDLAGQDDVMIGRGVAILSLLKECLETKSVELRSAAGECLALIHEARLNLGIASNEGENTTERRYRQGGWEGTKWEELMDEVKQRISELSVESGYHMSKKMKKEQRATFREYMATLVDDESPDEVINFRGGSMELSTWKEIVQLNFVRHCLQGGFQIQLLTNETLQLIFGADGKLLGAMTNMTQLEKRLVLSKTSEASKAADQELTKQRRARNNLKNYFLTADGDDI